MRTSNSTTSCRRGGERTGERTGQWSARRRARPRHGRQEGPCGARGGGPPPPRLKPARPWGPASSQSARASAARAAESAEPTATAESPRRRATSPAIQSHRGRRRADGRDSGQSVQPRTGLFAGGGEILTFSPPRVTVAGSEERDRELLLHPARGGPRQGELDPAVRRGGPSPDQSRRDFAIACWLLEAGADDHTIAATLAAARDFDPKCEGPSRERSGRRGCTSRARNRDPGTLNGGQRAKQRR